MNEKTKLYFPNTTQIPNIILDNLYLYSEPALKVLMFILRKTFGWHKQQDKIAYSQFKNATGLSINGIKSGIKELIKYKIINQKQTKIGYLYSITISDFEIELFETVSSDNIDNDAIVSPNDITVSPDDTELYHGMIPQNQLNQLNKTNDEQKNQKVNVTHSLNSSLKEKEKNIIPPDCLAVIDYLNLKTGKHFKYTDIYLKQINARFKEKHTLNDFKKVIDYKCSQWLNDVKMNEYLRPQTLFSTKFESYLQMANSQENKFQEVKIDEVVNNYSFNLDI